eukprot:scaffold20430_cov120-Cylindrotheca_fusiformis.AAC.1
METLMMGGDVNNAMKATSVCHKKIRERRTVFQHVEVRKPRTLLLAVDVLTCGIVLRYRRKMVGTAFLSPGQHHEKGINKLLIDPKS